MSYEQDVSFLIHVFVNFYLINGGKRKRRKPALAKRIREITNETRKKHGKNAFPQQRILVIDTVLIE